MTEAQIVEAETGGLMPANEGWFVLNAKDARWIDGQLGKYTGFEGKDARFAQLGINLNVLQPREPMTMYHRENAQEDFLVLAGECLLIVDGEERPMRRWDLFHCPAGVNHAILGAGDGPSLVLAVGARTGDEEEGLVYPEDPVAQQHRAAVQEETTDPGEAYANVGRPWPWGAYKQGWLPE